jgi:hypothetical protein
MEKQRRKPRRNPGAEGKGIVSISASTSEMVKIHTRGMCK